MFTLNPPVAHIRDRYAISYSKIINMFVIQMPGSAKGHKQDSYNESDLKRAVRAVVEYGRSKKCAATEFGISRETLRRHIKKVKDAKKEQFFR